MTWISAICCPPVAVQNCTNFCGAVSAAGKHVSRGYKGICGQVQLVQLVQRVPSAIGAPTLEGCTNCTNRTSKQMERDETIAGFVTNAAGGARRSVANTLGE